MPKVKTPRQKQIDRLDDLFRHIIYAKYNNACQLAGKTSTRCNGVRQCAHIITRGNYRLRWDVKNAVCLCSGHHKYYTHRNHEWFPIVQQYFPDLWAYVDLTRHKLGSTKPGAMDLIEIQLKQWSE